MGKRFVICKLQLTNILHTVKQYRRIDCVLVYMHACFDALLYLSLKFCRIAIAITDKFIMPVDDLASSLVVYHDCMYIPYFQKQKLNC